MWIQLIQRKNYIKYKSRTWWKLYICVFNERKLLLVLIYIGLIAKCKYNNLKQSVYYSEIIVLDSLSSCNTIQL